MIDSKIIDRINKLLALSKDDGATEAEASLAAEKAQQLMLEHNLSMATVEASGGKSADGNRVKEGLDRRQVYNWQKVLMGQIAALNFCYCDLRYEERGSRYGSRTKVFMGYRLIGREANVASTTVMFDYLVSTIDRLAKAHVQDPSRYFTRYAHSFREGCSDRIVDRLEEQQKTAIAEQERKAKEEQTRRQHPAYAGSNLPVVILSDYVQDEEDLNTDMLHGLEPGTTKRRRLERVARDAEWQRKQVIAREKQDAELARLIAAGESEEIAYYLSRGFTRERALELTAPAKPAKPMTDAQRQKHEEKRRRDEAREDERRWRKQQKEAQRIDRRGYEAGWDKGNDVSLNQQMDEDRKHRIGRA